MRLVKELLAKECQKIQHCQPLHHNQSSFFPPQVITILAFKKPASLVYV